MYTADVIHSVGLVIPFPQLMLKHARLNKYYAKSDFKKNVTNPSQTT